METLPPHLISEPEVIYPQPLRLDLLKREVYSPTPLSPWELRAVDEHGVESSYYERSLKRFEELIDPYRDNYPKWLVTAVETSLMSLHSTRCDRNFGAYMEQQKQVPYNELSLEAQELMDAALTGRLTIAELLKLHGMDISLSSTELAKESHCFEWDISGMKKAVREGVEEAAPDAIWNTETASCRYAFYRVVLDEKQRPKGLVVVRKRNVAALEDKSTVVERSTYVIRFDDEELPREFQELAEQLAARLPQDMPPDDLKESLINQLLAAGQEEKAREFLARTSNPEFAPGYADNISEFLASEGDSIELGIHYRVGWLVPVATSYYVRCAAQEAVAKDGSTEGKTYYKTSEVGQVALAGVVPN